MEQEFVWTVEAEAESGRWIPLARFRRPIDADHLLQMFEEMNARRRMRVRMSKTVAWYEPKGE